MTRLLLVVPAALLASGCAGQTAFERCVEHSVQEGVRQDAAERACEVALDDER